MKARGHHPLFFLWALGGAALLLAIIGSAPYLIALSENGDTAIIAGVHMGGRAIEKMDEQGLRNMIADFQQELLERGIPAIYGEKSATIQLLGSAQSPDIPLSAQQNIIKFDGDASIDAALAMGRSDGPLENLLKRLSLVFSPENIPLKTNVDRTELLQRIAQAFPDVRKESHDAELFFNRDNNTFVIVPSAEGISFDDEKAASSLEHQLNAFAFPSIHIEQIRIAPSVSTNNILGFEKKAETLIKNRSLTLVADDKRSWKLGMKEIGPWINVVRKDGNALDVDFSTDRIIEYLEKSIAPNVFVEAIDPTFEVRDGAVVILQSPRDGVKLDSEASAQTIHAALSANASDPVQLIIQEHKSRLMDIPQIGVIKEIVGKAETDFSGSPANRKKNIANGVRLLNGIIIEPQETFSLLSILSPIDGTNGYLPELVIKKDKTTPEYGGGLCQVSTTLFRAVSYSGLPIVERRNHSYRVSYYEPPVGFDATIYDSAPDFKFTNDMTTPLLVQASITGTKIAIVLWGTKDGRSVEVDKPTVFNIKKAPPQKFIETTDLPIGEKKCTEKAHNGADAYFERRVTYPDGNLVKETYKSHYVIWPSICYVGVEKTAEESKRDESEKKQEKNGELEPVTQ